MTTKNLATVCTRTAMLNVLMRCLAVTIIGLFPAVAPAYAGDESVPTDVERWNWSFSLGIATWSDLGNFESSSGGQFNSLGFALEFATHKKVARWGAADLLAGVDLGLFTTDSDIAGVSQDFTQRGLYLTPSVKLRFGERAKRYLNLEAGVGWYNTDFAELDCNTDGFLCAELDVPFDSDALGMYLGISGGLGRRMIVGVKVHYADFGSVAGIGSITSDLKGPLYTLSLGATFGD